MKCQFCGQQLQEDGLCELELCNRLKEASDEEIALLKLLVGLEDKSE